MSSLYKLVTNILWNILGKIGIQLCLLMISIVITRYLGAERLGLYATLLVVPSFVRLLSSFGLESVLNKMLPELEVKDPSRHQLRFLLKRVMAIRILSVIAFSVFLYHLVPYYFNFIKMQELIAYRIPLACYFFVLTVNSLLSIVFMTFLRFKIVSIVEGFCAFLNLAFLVCFVLLDKGIAGVLYAYTLSTGANILIYIFLARDDLLGDSQKCDTSGIPHLAWAAYMIGVFGFGVLTQSDVLLMNYFQVPSKEIGYYHLATGLSGMLVFSLAGIGPLAYSMFSESYTRNSAPGLAKSWHEIVGFASLLTAPIYVFSYFNTEQIISLFYGKDYVGAGMVFLVYLIFSSVQTLLGYDFSGSALMVINKKNLAMRVVMEGSALNVAINLMLIPRYGVMGAVFATGLVMIYMALRLLIEMSREIRIWTIFPFVGKIFLIALVCALPMELLKYLMGGNVVLHGVFYLLTLATLMLWIKPLTEEHRILAGEIHPRLVPLLSWFMKAA